jgi:TPP-dependent pyruvate/acetoin dehydrogenase alpha subunit
LEQPQACGKSKILSDNPLALGDAPTAGPAKAGPATSLSQAFHVSLTQDFYRSMLRIRAVEEALLALFTEGLIRGTVHTCLGQEAIPVGVVGALDKARDVVCSNHRGHGHFLAWSGNMRGLVAEIMGLPEGVCGGIGGSQHLHVPGFYSNGILGGMMGVANGMAFAEKAKKSGAVVAAFMGDGAWGEGIVYEALNMAALWKLPLLAVVEHNQYAQSTHWRLEHAGDLWERPRAFGIPTTVVDGNDIEEVARASAAVAGVIRSGGGPQVLFCQTYRLGPHSKGDDLRDPAEIEAARKNEPIARLRARLDPAWCAQAEAAAHEEVSSLTTQLKVAARA